MSAPQSVDASVRAERAAVWLQRSRYDSQTPAPVRAATWFRLAAALAAALCVAIIFGALPEPAEPVPPMALVPSTGALRASLQVQRDDQSFDYTAGMALLPGDRGRLRLESSSGGFLTLVRHTHDGLTTALDAVSVPGGTVFAPGEVLLDTSGGGETWYVLVAADRVPASHYETLLAAGHSPPVPVVVLSLGAAAATESRVTP